MLEGRVSLLCLLFLGSLACLIAPVSALERPVNKRSSVINVKPDFPDSVRLWPAQPRPSVVTDIQMAAGRQGAPVGEDAALPLTTSTISSNTTPTLKYSHAPTITSRPSMLGRRTFVENNDALVISSLNSALASATASALFMSESMAKEFASSLGELQASAEILAASASSALAAASSAVVAAEQSAAQAIFRAEESAASVVKVATRVATDSLPEQTTRTQTQSQLELEAAEGAAMSITRAAVAIVVSIVVSAICSILGFYLFLRYRRARRKRKREEGREVDQAETAEPRTDDHPNPTEQPEQGPREHERDWSATEALARAVVSYIEKEQMPTPVAPMVSSSPVHPTGPLSPHLHPPPTPYTPVTPGTPARSPFPPSPVTPPPPGNLLLPTRYSMPKPGKKEPPSPVSPVVPSGRKEPPSPVSPAVPGGDGKIGFAVGGEVDDPLWVSQHPPPSHPPPPTPLRSPHHRKTSSESTVRSRQSHRRTMSNPNQIPQLPKLPRLSLSREPDEQSPPQDSDGSIYEGIITHPLEPVATNDSRISRPASVAGGTAAEIHPPERSEKRDSNWPLPKTGWL